MQTMLQEIKDCEDENGTAKVDSALLRYSGNHVLNSIPSRKHSMIFTANKLPPLSESCAAPLVTMMVLLPSNGRQKSAPVVVPPRDRTRQSPSQQINPSPLKEDPPVARAARALTPRTPPPPSQGDP